MWGCPHCGGVWLDNATAQRVVQTLCQASLSLAQQAAQSSQAKLDLSTELMCPVCHHPMARHRVEKAWLDIDWCQHHGTWYDKGELDKVARTAHVQSTDWRSAPQAPQHNPYAQQQQAAHGGGNFNQDDDGWDHSEIATEIAAEVAVEASFAIIFALFD